MSTPINDGGPAFPASLYKLENGQESSVPHIGMTLRDYFAGQALVGILGSGDAKIENIIRDKSSAATFSQSCYAIADSMIEARKEVIK